MTNEAIITACNTVLGLTVSNQSLEAFNDRLPMLRTYYGDLERHEDLENGYIWVTPWNQPERKVLELDLLLNTITRTYQDTEP